MSLKCGGMTECRAFGKTFAIEIDGVQYSEWRGSFPVSCERVFVDVGQGSWGTCITPAPPSSCTYYSQYSPEGMCVTPIPRFGLHATLSLLDVPPPSQGACVTLATPSVCMRLSLSPSQGACVTLTTPLALLISFPFM